MAARVLFVMTYKWKMYELIGGDLLDIETAYTNASDTALEFLKRGLDSENPTEVVIVELDHLSCKPTDIPQRRGGLKLISQIREQIGWPPWIIGVAYTRKADNLASLQNATLVLRADCFYPTHEPRERFYAAVNWLLSQSKPRLPEANPWGG